MNAQVEMCFPAGGRRRQRKQKIAKRRKLRVVERLNEYDPTRLLKISCGVGVDSVAMLVGLKRLGIRPDVILFADTGEERLRTYLYVPILQRWLERVGFPKLTVVYYEPVRAPYTTLAGKCHANETLPSISFGGKSCSLVFKKAPQEKWMKQWQPAIDSWARGEKVQCAIGYDAGTKDARRTTRASDDDYDYLYFLRLWGWDRERCAQEILDEGLPVPDKSACWCCGAAKPAEVLAMRNEEPHHFYAGIAMEERARNGKHGLDSIKGLGRSWSWADLLPERTAYR